MCSAGSMKRPRDEEEYDNSAPAASRRLHSRRPAPPPPADGPPPSPPTVLAYDALLFVAAVKREFASEPGKYQEFLAILREFTRGSSDIAGAMDRFQAVLRGHPDLIRGFNAFMPEGEGLKEEQGGDGDA